MVQGFYDTHLYEYDYEKIDLVIERYILDRK